MVISDLVDGGEGVGDGAKVADLPEFLDVRIGRDQTRTPRTLPIINLTYPNTFTFWRSNVFTQASDADTHFESHSPTTLSQTNVSSCTFTSTSDTNLTGMGKLWFWCNQEIGKIKRHVFK